MNHMHHTTMMPNMNNHSTSGGGMNHGNMNSGHMMMMQMWFTAGKDVTILFKGWKVDSVGGLIGSMIALLLLGIVYEGIKIGRELLKRRAARPVIEKETFDLSGDAAKKTPQPTIILSHPRQLMMSKLHFVQTFLHMLQVFIGYLLMLAFMTFNAWLCIAIILGAGIGYFLFGWKSVSIVDIGDHCL